MRLSLLTQVEVEGRSTDLILEISLNSYPVKSVSSVFT